jgi:S-formylglutathione hydrolase
MCHVSLTLFYSSWWRGNRNLRNGQRCWFAETGEQGTADNFYKQKQLLPENLEMAVQEAGLEGLTVRYQDVGYPLIFLTQPAQPVRLTYHQGYDHSYFFISTFGADHVNHAAKYLGV